MEHKKTRKKDGNGLYIAICCCILLIALIGYANNISLRNKENDELLANEVGENVTVYETPEEISVNEEYEQNDVIAEEFVSYTERSYEVVDETEPVSKKEITVEEPCYLTPVSGGVICEFSENKPVYHSSTDDWRTHNGVDLEATVGDSVAACADGVVEKVYMGSLGYSIRIDHGDGMMSVYSNLDENPTVALGDSVKKGDVIGHIGESAVGDLCTKPHLHFEIISQGKYENPVNYLN